MCPCLPYFPHRAVLRCTANRTIAIFKDGDTPVDIARLRRHTAVVDLLQAHVRLSSGSSGGKPKRKIHMLTGTTGTQIQFRRVPLHGRVSSDSSIGKLEQSKVK